VLAPATGVLVLAGALHGIMVVDLLDYVTSHYDPEYGTPLAGNVRLAEAVATDGARAGSRRAFIELRTPEAGAMAYLLREWFPAIELAQVGEVGLGSRFANAGAPDDPEPVLGSPVTLDLQYADGVAVRSAAVQSGWAPGEPVRLVMTWTYDGQHPLTTPSVVWDVVLRDARGESVRHQSGLSHTRDQLPIEQALLSWFMLETDASLPPGPYQLGLRRVQDPPSTELRFPLTPSPLPLAPSP
jgi:hypothetical protein